jgi:hypothetical protein
MEPSMPQFGTINKDNQGQLVPTGEVTADEDIVIDAIDQHCENLTFTSTGGSVRIQQGVQQHCTGIKLSARRDVFIGVQINQHCDVTISAGGSVSVGEKFDQHCNVDITAAGDVNIGQKFDQHCNVSIQAGGSVSIGQKIDAQCSVSITSGGSISIGQKIDGGSEATLIARTSISIGQKIDGGSKVHHSAPSFTPGSEGLKGGSTEDQISGRPVVTKFIDGGSSVFESQLTGRRGVSATFTMLLSGPEGNRATRLLVLPEFTVGQATITGETAGDGAFDAANGRMTLPATIQASIAGLSGSTGITLTTDSATSPNNKFTEQGSPVQADGSAVLAAAGFISAASVGTDFGLKLSGKFDPAPS